MPEGVNCLLVGKLDDYPEEMIICGCGTTIWGLKSNGGDVFWTALGDEINVLEVCDTDLDGRNEVGLLCLSRASSFILSVDCRFERNGDQSLQKRLFLVEKFPNRDRCMLHSGL